MSSPYLILYVDDNRDSCELVSVLLHHSELNCEVVSADTAEAALLLMAEQKFDFYILDYALPKTSGVELCRRIRRDDAQTPLLFFTAMARSVEKENALNAGANEYLIKPNDLENLVEKVVLLMLENASAKKLTPGGFSAHQTKIPKFFINTIN